ncbi:MAG: hypothetical protein KDK48_01595 [Chlamydiia bacterium]|nr:hypothetical protein [Chlamydiia bacterium]
MKRLLLLLLLLNFSAPLFAEEGCPIDQECPAPKRCGPRYIKRCQVDPYWVPAALIGACAGGVVAIKNESAGESFPFPGAELIEFIVRMEASDFSTSVVQILLPNGDILDAIQLEGEGSLSGSYTLNQPLPGTYIMRLIQATGDITSLTGEILVDGANVVGPDAFALPPPSEINYTIPTP